MSLPSRIRLAIAACGVAVLGLTSGCGVNGAELRPGVAAEIDGTTIRMDQVDQATRAFCVFNASDSTTPVLTGYAARTTMVEGLVARIAADHLNQSYGKTPSPWYSGYLAAQTAAFGQLSSDQVADLLPAITGFAYFIDLVGQFADPAGASASTTQAEAIAKFQKGLPLAVAWGQDHPITTDPSLPALDFDPSQVLAPSDQDVSQAVSDFAQTADAANAPSPTGSATSFPSDLPESQRCG